MLRNFRAYQAAKQLYQTCEVLSGPPHLLAQLVRAPSSVALNLAEGSERVSPQDKRRSYRIAMGSLRETQAILDLMRDSPAVQKARLQADFAASQVFNLTRVNLTESKIPKPPPPSEPSTANREQ